MTTLLLASASPARLSTLRSAGLDPQVRVSSVDEDAVLAEGRERFGALEPADAVLLLAQAKAEDVTRSLEQTAAGTGTDADTSAGEAPAEGSGVAALPDLVVGCDSMLELDGEIFGKPADAETAVARWRTMRGRSGVLHTGHWVVDLRDPEDGGTGGTLGATSSTTVHFAQVSDEEIEAYVATGEPLAVAGAFTLDGRGGAFVSGVEGDHHGVVGISLPLLRELLDQVGVRWTDLW
ncbi:Maf family protein [Sanguibacter inulinus]|uniref:Nucleoside triphosphate pyrophosphatase n=1 Tax=Sanguibacter inulinus TaxID=60922 RepID=A0A853EWB4_9MICO|nr:Maf family protein [Sanguibacter inulinus]MBF0723752.1 septum formation inhibitor Maf [Sanguibacter inulinus]NYS94897.1 septum formation inhibitor Maf [Sanguibacter inulinus]